MYIVCSILILYLILWLFNKCGRSRKRKFCDLIPNLCLTFNINNVVQSEQYQAGSTEALEPSEISEVLDDSREGSTPIPLTRIQASRSSRSSSRIF